MSDKKLGELSEQEMSSFQEMRQEEADLTYKIGLKSREIQAMSIAAGQVRQKSIDLMAKVRERLEIDDGVPIKVNQDGTVYEVEQSEQPR